MLDKGASNYNHIAEGAAIGGHKDIVQWMLDLSSNRSFSIL